MPTTGHVIRRVVIIVTQDANEAGAGIGANVIKEIRQTCAAELADHRPALDANVLDILYLFRQRLQAGERIAAGPLDFALDDQLPLIEVDVWFVGVEGVVGKLLERRQLVVSKRRSEVRRAKQRFGNAITKGEARFQHRFTHGGKSQGAQGGYWRESQPLSPRQPA